MRGAGVLTKRRRLERVSGAVPYVRPCSLPWCGVDASCITGLLPVRPKNGFAPFSEVGVESRQGQGLTAADVVLPSCIKRSEGGC